MKEGVCRSCWKYVSEEEIGVAGKNGIDALCKVCVGRGFMGERLGVVDCGLDELVNYYCGCEGHIVDGRGSMRLNYVYVNMFGSLVCEFGEKVDVQLKSGVYERREGGKVSRKEFDGSVNLIR